MSDIRLLFSLARWGNSEQKRLHRHRRRAIHFLAVAAYARDSNIPEGIVALVYNRGDVIYRDRGTFTPTIVTP
jgi:hypothetical protein